jgi:predicted methyltransferase
MKTLLACASMALCVVGCVSTDHSAGSGKVPDYVTTAVAEPSRPDADRKRDADRKPDQVLTFSGIKPGDKVLELQPGGGYYTRLLCLAVGLKGQVTTLRVTPATPVNRPTPPDVPTPCKNITAVTQKITELSLPGGQDAVWTSENYHDLHLPVFAVDINAFDKAVFNALKPGGVFIIEDHAAVSGSGSRDSGTLHRIDPELVKQEVTSAGFVFVGASEVLHRDDDPMTGRVFELQGKTNKFLFKFRKPKK